MCPECKKVTAFVSDHSAGDTICTECGLVVEARVIDETSEWRTFSSGDTTRDDPNRVGGPTNELLSDGGMGTIISKSVTGGDFTGMNLSRWQNRTSNPDRNLLSAFRTISEMAERLNLVVAIKDRACEIYKEIQDSQSIRGRSQAAICGACLYIACRQEEKARSFKEIGMGTQAATVKEIKKCTAFVVNTLSKQMGVVSAADYVRRFASNLDLKHKFVQAAEEVVRRFDAYKDKGRSPISVAAGVIFMLSQLTEVRFCPNVFGMLNDALIDCGSPCQLWIFINV